MKRLLSILILLAGLGSCFSFSQVKEQPDPFDRYLAGLKANHPEDVLVRFAANCGVDIESIKPRFAQSPQDNWVLVNDLSNALKDQETDFYATVAIWHAADRILIEQWGMELDTGNYSRHLICLQRQKIIFFESSDWTIPPVETAQQRAAYPAWGYEQRWNISTNGRYEKVLSRFIDVDEHPINEPALDLETRKGLDLMWTVYTWRDLKFPNALLTP